MAAAIVDCQLGDRDTTPLARQLAGRRVPFVIHTATLLASMEEFHPPVPVLIKPLRSCAVLTCLLDEMRRCGATTASPRLGHPPKRV